MKLKTIMVNYSTFKREMEVLDGVFEYNEIHGYEFIHKRQGRKKIFYY
jgi:hypothetical protein